MKKQIHVQYYAVLRERRKISKESIETESETAHDLFQELDKAYQFNLPIDIVKVSINNQFVDWTTKLRPGDKIVFIPPVAGG